MLRLIMLVLVTALGCETGSAQSGRNSANTIMPGCREVVAENYTIQNAANPAFCMGLLVGLASGDPMICIPKEVTYRQAVRVVVQYIDQRPARMHEDFLSLAAEILSATWPCKSTPR